MAIQSPAMPWQLARRSLPVVTGHVSRPLSTHWHLARPDQKRHGSLPVPGPLDKTNRATGRTRQDGMACRDGAERHGWVARPRPSLTSQPASQPHRRSRRGPRGTKRRGGRTEERRCRALLLSPAAPDSDSPLLVGFSEASRVLILVESDGSV